MKSKSTVRLVSLCFTQCIGYASALAGTIPSQDWATHALEDCLHHHGATRQCHVGISLKTGFRGLIADCDLRPGDVALTIPHSCTLAVEEEQETNTDGTVNSALSCDDDWAGKLAQKLIRAQRISRDNGQGKNVEGKESIFEIYARSLPTPPDSPARGDWSGFYLEAFQNEAFVQEIAECQEWRKRKWISYRSAAVAQGEAIKDNKETFLDALDLVSSRTIQCRKKNSFVRMLVPFLDMANHASSDEGGGYYQRNPEDNSISLLVGQRGVRAGEEVCLDYGTRRNEDWLLHYGFLPQRNPAESVPLNLNDGTKTVVSWKTVHEQTERLRGTTFVGQPMMDSSSRSVLLQEACRAEIQQAPTTLSQDLQYLGDCAMNDDWRLQMALQYRVARKSLLTALTGEQAVASAATSAFRM